MAYDGWSNRETWLVNVWFDPESKEDVQFAKSILEEQYDAMENGALKDMLNFGAINWDELESHFDDEESDENEEE